MAFNLTAKTIIKSATLELDGSQLVVLAEAAPHLRKIMGILNESHGAEDIEAGQRLAVVDSLLASIESLVNQAGVVQPKVRRGGRQKANPTAG